MPNTLPGVKVTLADGYLSASDDSVNAERLLIIAAPDSTIETGWQAGSPTNVPYNPTNYKTEADVVKDWGAGSDVHVAFVMALRSGASSIYISATDSSKTNYSTDVKVRETEFEAALDHADLVNPDLIVAHGFYANEVVATAGEVTGRLAKFANDLATTCYTLSNESNPCHGIMGVVPCDEHVSGFATYDASTVAGYIDDLTDAAAAAFATTPLPIANVIADLQPAGDTDPKLDRYLSLFVGEVIVNKQPARVGESVAQYEQCAAAAAGLVYKNGLDRAITGMPMVNVLNLAYNLSKSQRLALVGKYVNPLALSADRQIVCVDGWTLAQPDAGGYASVYGRLSTVLVVNEVSKSTRKTLEGFVGMQASTARMNSISTALSSLYLVYKQKGILRDSSFTMNFDQATNALSVDVTLVPFGEIREVNVTISVKLS